jgi:branched-chain amino acid transport system ATP-binding protein
MLKLSSVNSFYGQVHALWDVDLEVGDESVVGVIGPNGAGKSTLLKTILGVVPSYTGTIEFGGKSIDRLPPRERVRCGITYVPEGRRIFPEMTVRENLSLGALTPKARAHRDKNFEEVHALFPILHERRRQLAGTLSGGELQMLALARGLMSAPELLMIDEPSLGLSPTAIANVFAAIKKIRETGKSILLVEQNVPRLLNLAPYVLVIENGRIVSAGKSTELRKEFVTKSYLGL